MSESVVITGANRGIGLKLAQSYIDVGSRVYAGCRKPEMANELAHLTENSNGLLSVHPLDVKRITTQRLCRNAKRCRYRRTH